MMFSDGSDQEAAAPAEQAVQGLVFNEVNTSGAKVPEHGSEKPDTTLSYPAQTSMIKF